MAAGDGFELEVYDDELGRYVRVPVPSAKPLAVRKKTAQAKEPSAGDYLNTLGDVLFVNPRNSAAATLGGAAYDYAVKSTPRSVVRDITESAEDAGDWLRKEGKLIRAAPITESLRLLKAGFIDPLADPYRVFKQAATERARGNEVGGKKLAAMVPLAVAGVLPQGRGASKVATKAGVEAAETSATKAATKAATKTAEKPLTEKQFERNYLQHIDLRNRKGKAEGAAQKIKTEGFRPGAGVNLMTVWRGGEPQNVVQKRFLPQKGDTVYLVPKSAQVKMRGEGEKVAEGWKPAPHEVLTISETGQDLYQAYLDKFAAKSKTATPSMTVTPAAKPATPAKAFSDINPDLYGLRKTKDLPRLQASPVKKERFSVAAAPDKVSLGDYEGRPFIISMSDRSAAGDRITGVGDVDLNLPVDLQGGQDFMFSPSTGGLVWASEAAPVSNIMNLARRLYDKTGEKPLYLPYRMGGEGSDFATMTGETMMSYADAALGKSDKADMNRLIQQYIPDFAGISDPEGYRQFANLVGNKRKQLQLDLSNTFGEDGGGLTLPMTRAMIADPSQLDKPSFFLQNVGEIDPTADVSTATGHRTYSRGVPGRGLGVLADDVNVAQLLPDLSEMYQIGDPRQFRGQNADFTDYGREQKIAEEAAMREKALRQGKTPKVYNTERGGTSKYMMSGAKFGVLTPELLRLLAGE